MRSGAIGAFFSLCERKAPTAAALFAAIAVLVAAALAGGGFATAAAAECEWQPHKVRVVKHVKRHGKRVKVVRKRVRWSCVAVPAAATPAPTAAAPAAPTPTPAPGPPAPPVFSPEDLSNPHFLGAQAYEFGFTPTKPSFELQAGADTIEMINRGEDAHDLHLESLLTHATVLEVSPTGSGGHARASAVLEAGEYRLYCSLADHAELGMERTVVVTP
jgi:plastocyanin